MSALTRLTIDRTTGKRILGAMIGFTREQVLWVLGALPIGDVDRHPPETHDPSTAIDGRRHRPNTPTQFLVGTILKHGPSALQKPREGVNIDPRPRGSPNSRQVHTDGV